MSEPSPASNGGDQKPAETPAPVEPVLDATAQLRLADQLLTMAWLMITELPAAKALGIDDVAWGALIRARSLMVFPAEPPTPKIPADADPDDDDEVLF